MEKLRAQLDELISRLENETELRQRLDDLLSVFPFNEYEYIISTLLGLDKLSLDEYYELRDEYISRNMFLYVFEISAPRGFGETWAQGHLKELVPELVKPSRKRDHNYSGQYDFYLDEKIRIEVKASRAVDFNSRESLPVKALSSDSNKSFDMNFQQTKPACCDVFIWVGVWRDVIRYWVLSSDEVANNKYFSKGQHRGNVGEGQLHLKDDNISEFAEYEVKPNCLLGAIREAYQRQMKSQG
ncbi:TPA: hypothetical protein EYP12_01935 [Candidatus Bipolaricaulota bacterium]|nr:hypothetical protein [Candidatus Bipolaricaulota bacterium]